MTAPMTPELAQRIFPVAPSDRRLNKDLFAEAVPADRLKDDSAFYAGLLTLMEGEGIDLLRQFDRRMIKQGDERKTFGARALKHLHHAAQGALDTRDINAVARHEFAHDNVEAWVQAFFLRLHGIPEPAHEAPTDSGEAEDWGHLARRLQDSVALLENPDPDEAERILSLAQALVEACRIAARAEAEKALSTIRIGDLRARLEATEPSLVTDWPTAPDPDWLDSLETALAAVESLRDDLARQITEAEELREAMRKATDAGDLEAEDEILRRRRAASAQTQACKDSLSQARGSLAALFAPRAADETSVPDPLPLQDAEPETPAEPAVEIVETAEEPPLSISTPAPEPDEAEAPTEDHPEIQPPAPLHPIVTQSPPVFESPASTDEAVLGHYLQAGEVDFAWHLARLTEEQGRGAPVPAAVLRATWVLGDVRKAEDMADPRRSKAMAEMMAAASEAGSPAATSRVQLAALLRPALFDPDNGARGVLSNISRDDHLAPFVPLIEALSGLGHDIRLSVQILGELAGAKPPAAEPEAVRALKDWLTWAENRKTQYQPAYRLLHRELKPDGALGQVITAVLSGKKDAIRLVGDMLDTLDRNRTAQESWVLDAEQRMGRLARAPIEGAALDWLCNRLQEACDKLSAWCVARGQDAAKPQDRSEEKLRRAIGTVRKAMDRLPPSPSAELTDIERAAEAYLLARISAFRDLLDGRIDTILLRESSRLTPMLRLPGGCQDWTDEGGPAFAAERTARDRRLLAALRRPECIAPTLREALDARLAENAILSAKELLSVLAAQGLEESELGILRQRVAENAESARRKSRERVERLRQSLTTLGYLDLETSAELQGDLSRLSLIVRALSIPADDDDDVLPAASGRRKPEIPADFPELSTLLDELESKRDRLRRDISSQQRAALQSLTTGKVGASALAILAEFDRLDPVMIDDAVAELTAGRDVPLPERDAPDAFERFFPHFVARLEAAAQDTTRGRIISSLDTGNDTTSLGLTTLETPQRKRLKLMLENWSGGENALKQNNQPSLREKLEQLFAQIGLTGIRISDGREAIPRRMRSLSMAFDVPQPTEWFLPPAYGSSAGGRYRLLLVHAEVSVDQVLRQISSDAPDTAWIVLFFGRLGVQDRRTLGRRVRADARQVLFLDETLLLFLGLEPGDPLSLFFSAALPFSWVQPYTTSAGEIPREVFFGRREEIERIVAREGGGSLIYGGRQLGKSALLNHIRRERHRPEHGELALYLDIKPIGGTGLAAAQIWDELAHALGQCKGFADLPTQPNDMVTAIKSWLDADPSRRIIAMFDESDNFLTAEHVAGYPNLQKLKTLMESSGRRFKAVFAGLHNVRRMARTPNSPLPHLGAPICIGPMNLSRENRSALRRLAVEPIHAAGLDYANPALVSDMLARMNYYPSLVQVFGRQIVESFGRKPAAAAGQGPRWKLDRESLFEGEAAEGIAVQIRERFQLTLNLDLRYEGVAKSIALHRLDAVGGDTEVLSQGLDAQTIRRITFWPKGATQLSNPDFEELLMEMVDLGVLGRFPGNRFGLRNAQVAQMLGQREALEDALLALQEREQEPGYDAAEFHSLLRPTLPNHRAPLSDSALKRLFDIENRGLRLVVAPAAIVGGDVARRLEVAAGIMGQLNPVLVAADPAAIRREIDTRRAKVVTLIIEGPWSADVAHVLSNHDRVKKGQVLPIWCLTEAPKDTLGALVVRAAPWTEAMLRHWLADESLSPALDDSETRTAILAASGGAPHRLGRLRPVLSEIATLPIPERIRRLEEWRTKEPLSGDSIGLAAGDQKILSDLAGLQDVLTSFAEFLAEVPGATREGVERLRLCGVLVEGDGPADPPRLTPLGHLVSR